ncbi:MAG: sulfatase-like hydrolase/transferase [Kiritimatiellales bacterium]|nr:sulfatase-like hydrolase/transferase [Kiritimatiellales bacterium]
MQAAAAGGLAFRQVLKARAAESDDYNILIIQTDEHSPHVLGCYGNSIVQTPALDSLASAGVVFTSAYCQDPICVPSRMSMLTGRMGSDVGVYNNSDPLKLRYKTFADSFNAAGYLTTIIGKMHFQGEGEERVHGFYRPFGDGGSEYSWSTWQKDRMDGQVYLASRLPEDAEASDWPISAEKDSGAREYSLQFLEDHRYEKFFLITSFIKPHFPFTCHERYFNLYENTVDMPPSVTQEMLDDLPPVSQNERDKYGFANLNDAQIKTARAHYYGMVTYIDDQVQALLDKLDELNLRDKTIIVYTSDHGEMAGEHGLWYKNCFYEASVGIPFIWSFPARLPQGMRISAPVMNMDIFPTLCDLCDVPQPDDLQGKSLLPLIDGAESGADRIALSENFRSKSAGRMIRTMQYKYTWFADGKQQLFDMTADPLEVNNLIHESQYDELVAALKEKALRGWRFNREIHEQGSVMQIL